MHAGIRGAINSTMSGMSFRRVGLGFANVGKRLQTPVQRLRAASSTTSSVPAQLMTNVWRKSNILYITYVIAGCVVLEGIYGSFTNAVWDTYNSGVSTCLTSVIIFLPPL